MIRKITIGLCISLFLVSCGTKPKDLTPPNNSNVEFPRTYPNPNTDPK